MNFSFSFTKAQMKFLSGMFTNLASGWVGVIILTPILFDLSLTDNLYRLILHIISAILCSVLAIRFEKELEK